jgi:penicillin-binding protein 1A
LAQRPSFKRATFDPELQAVAEIALQRALETYDRAQGIWRGTGLSIDPERLTSEDAWRAALSDIEVPRGIKLDGQWYPAVVLKLGKKSAQIGIEGVEEDEDGHWIPSRDVIWASKQKADGSLGPKAKRAPDLLSLGDVVLVRALLDEAVYIAPMIHVKEDHGHRSKTQRRLLTQKQQPTSSRT